MRVIKINRRYTINKVEENKIHLFLARKHHTFARIYLQTLTRPFRNVLRKIAEV